MGSSIGMMVEKNHKDHFLNNFLLFLDAFHFLLVLSFWAEHLSCVLLTLLLVIYWLLDNPA